MLRVIGPTTNVYWRATTLDEYTGLGWIESLKRDDVTAEARLDLARDPLLPAAARDERNWLQQDVTVARLADEHLISAGQPVRWQLTGGQAVQPAESGVVFVADGIQPGQRYTVWSYAPDIAPDQLIGLQPAYPRAVARYLEVLPGVAVPPFGAVNRERRIAALFAEQEGTPNERVCAQHERLYEQAQDVVGSAPTPYLAVVGLEQWFRSTGGFSYNELPPRPSGTEPPLVEFVLTGQEGYCQHYAGAMALMLRMLGIPACVAAGFVSGDLDEDTGVWTVTDRDAHTWVEVWFPTFGRLSFDPTPGRGNLGEAYSVSSEAFALGTEGGGSGLFSEVPVGGGGLPFLPTSSSGFPAWAVAVLVVIALSSPCCWQSSPGASCGCGRVTHAASPRSCGATSSASSQTSGSSWRRASRFRRSVSGSKGATGSAPRRSSRRPRPRASVRWERPSRLPHGPVASIAS